MEISNFAREVIIFSIIFFFVGGIFYNAVVEDKEVKAKKPS
jgi:hypothetical protein